LSFLGQNTERVDSFGANERFGRAAELAAFASLKIVRDSVDSESGCRGISPSCRDG
jgi:hypothetical protein